MTYDIAIIGAGASGLAAGIAAARRLPPALRATPLASEGGLAGARVVLLERMPRVGKKILATGNGRCNLGNRNAPEHPYHNREFVIPALERFESSPLSPRRHPPSQAKGAWGGCEAFFDSLGLAIQEGDEGRLYPRSNMAASVLNALRYGAQRAGCEIRCDCPVTEIKPADGGFLVNQNITARRVIIAAGGCAAPAQGSDGSGFALLRSLGHRIIEPRPALVQITVKSPVLAMLKGLRVRAEIRIGQARAAGEVLFAQDGLSGIAAMEVSREAVPGSAAVLDLLPEYSIKELTALLLRWQDCCGTPEEGGYSPAQLLSGLLPGRVAEAVVRTPRPCGPPGLECDRTGSILPGCLSGPSEEGGLAYACKNFTFEVTGTRGFGHAQVTAGGADVAQFEPHTMQSRVVPGLYACGEALDVDGGCGGFNLHWAWASGALAGQCAAR